jgi:hypothetical protein
LKSTTAKIVDVKTPFSLSVIKVPGAVSFARFVVNIVKALVPAVNFTTVESTLISVDEADTSQAE